MWKTGLGGEVPVSGAGSSLEVFSACARLLNSPGLSFELLFEEAPRAAGADASEERPLRSRRGWL